MTVIATILEERNSTHGEFKDNAHLTVEMEYAASQGKNWSKFSDVQTLATRMILHKLSRALSGDHNHVDTWEDIAGYAELVVRDLREEERTRGSIVDVEV